jgi:hypothetical protein
MPVKTTKNQLGIFGKFWHYLVIQKRKFVNYWTAIGQKYPKLKLAYNIVTHPTTIRILALGFAIATTILSGGTAPAIAFLALAFAASLIAVYYKARQLYNTEKVNQQKLIIKKIIVETKLSQSIIKDLSPTQRRQLYQNLVDYRLKDRPIHTISNLQKPTKLNSFLKTVRDIGFENVLPVITYAVSANIPGAVAYSIALIFTTAYETKARVLSSEKKRLLSIQINKLCQDHQIKKFENIIELFKYYLEKKAEKLALDKTMQSGSFNIDQFVKHKETIFAELLNTELPIFLHKKPKREGDLQQASLWRRLAYTLVPWHSTYVEDIHTQYQQQMPKTAAKQTSRKPNAENLAAAQQASKIIIRKLAQQPKTLPPTLRRRTTPSRKLD